MIYAWANPLNLPWLVFDSDHTAKGIQLFLVLSIGIGVISWWGARLGYPAHLIFLAAVLATLTPIMLHAQSHTHYAGSVYWALVVLAAYTRFLEEGGGRRLLFVALSWMLLIAINYVTINLFTAVALVLCAASYLWSNRDGAGNGPVRRRIFIRIGWNNFI